MPDALIDKLDDHLPFSSLAQSIDPSTRECYREEKGEVIKTMFRK